LVYERRVIGYVRIGPRERRESRPGRRSQRDAIEAECARRGWELVRVEQDVRSGRTLRRHGLHRAFAACRDGEADAVVVARLDRLTYSAVDLARLVAEATEARVGLVAFDVGLDLSTHEGGRVAAVLAEAASWHESPLARARTVFTGRPDGELPRRRGRPSSTPQELAERIRGLRAAGLTLQSICDLLNAEQVPTPRGGTHWRPSSLRAILKPRPGEAPEGRT
jgi:DNA invertase Pin-like site-specific DNA recombinase